MLLSSLSRRTLEADSREASLTKSLSRSLLSAARSSAVNSLRLHPPPSPPLASTAAKILKTSKDSITVEVIKTVLLKLWMNSLIYAKVFVLPSGGLVAEAFLEWAQMLKIQSLEQCSLHISCIIWLPRDSYGFTVRPQHLETYGVYNHVYKEEEEERLEKWNNFLEQYGGTVQLSSPTNVPSEIADDKAANGKAGRISKNCPNNCKLEMEIPLGASSKSQTWIPIRPPLSFIDKMMGVRVKNKAISNEYNNMNNLETLFPCKEELEFLVRGGVPKHLRGEIWQAFTGVQTRYVDKYYHNLVSSEMDPGNKKGQNGSINTNDHHVPEKIKKQIEKDLSRTFPGHPALTDDGRNSLRRILIAYARHNPSVGYCQSRGSIVVCYHLTWTLSEGIGGSYR